MKVHGCFCFAFIYPTHPPHLGFSPPDTFLFGTSSNVNFTVELSEVLSVVIVLVFNYEYFDLHILGILASTTDWKPHRLFFFSFRLSFLSVGKIFYILYMNTVLLFAVWENTHLHLVITFFFSRVEKKTKKQEKQD